MGDIKKACRFSTISKTCVLHKALNTYNKNYYGCLSGLHKIMNFWNLIAVSIIEIQCTQGANFNILPRKFNRVKEGDRTFSITTSKCWNHLLLRIRTSSSVNVLYKHLRLSQITL